MKALILILLIWIIPLAFAKESAWENTPTNKIRYSVFNRMTFRQPVVFTPFDVKVGYVYYGRKKYWSQLPYNSSDITVTTNSSPITFKVIFSKSITGFESTDVTIGNGTIGNFAGSDTDYSFDVTPTAEGNVTVDIGADVATDTEGRYTFPLDREELDDLLATALTANLEN